MLLVNVPEPTSFQFLRNVDGELYATYREACQHLHLLEDIRTDLEEIGINVGNWVDSAQDMNYWRALVNAALNLQVP